MNGCQMTSQQLIPVPLLRQWCVVSTQQMQDALHYLAPLAFKLRVSDYQLAFSIMFDALLFL